MGLKKLKPCGPDLQEARKKEAQVRNKATYYSTEFLNACKVADVKPTKRQAAKWNKKKGKAYSNK